MAASSELYNKIAISGSTSPQSTPGTKTYKGFSTVATDSHSFALYDLNLIKQDIINHFHIRIGEILERPTFGTIIWDMLFEPLTDHIKQMIVSDVNKIINYDPRVVAKKSTVSQYENGLVIDCQLEYLPYHIIDQLQLRFDENNGLMHK